MCDDYTVFSARDPSRMQPCAMSTRCFQKEIHYACGHACGRSIDEYYYDARCVDTVLANPKHNAALNCAGTHTHSYTHTQCTHLVLLLNLRLL